MKRQILLLLAFYMILNTIVLMMPVSAEIFTYDYIKDIADLTERATCEGEIMVNGDNPPVKSSNVVQNVANLFIYDYDLFNMSDKEDESTIIYASATQSSTQNFAQEATQSRSSPKTGDGTVLLAVVCALALSITVLVLRVKRRK